MIGVLLLATSVSVDAQGIDFMAIQRGRQQAQQENYVDQLRQYDPGAAMREEQMWQQQEYQRQMLEQQRLQNELLQQQLRQQQYGSTTTTNCYRDGWGGIRCTTQ
ncbi:hypothetical protein WLV51_09780 [Bordetella bronchiseptica]